MDYCFQVGPYDFILESKNLKQIFLKDELKKSLPDILITHGLISDRDGHLGIVMLELGHLETYLTRKAINSNGKALVNGYTKQN